MMSTDSVHTEHTTKILYSPEYLIPVQYYIPDTSMHSFIDAIKSDAKIHGLAHRVALALSLIHI